MEQSFITTFNPKELKSLIKQAITEINGDVIDMGSKKYEDIFFDQRQAAKFLNVSLPTIIKWKKNGKIPYYQEGRKVLFNKSQLLKAMQKNESLIR